MSAQFIVLFNGHAVRFLDQRSEVGGQKPARRVFELVNRENASIFVSEADGWAKVQRTPGLNPVQLVEVVGRS